MTKDDQSEEEGRVLWVGRDTSVCRRECGGADSLTSTRAGVSGGCVVLCRASGECDAME